MSAFVAVGALVAAMALTAVLALQRILGSTVAEAMREALRWHLQVPIELGHIYVSVFKWTVEIDHLVVKNPKGFSSEALLSAEKISVSTETMGFVLSRGKQLTINELVFSGVHAHVEYQTGDMHHSHTNIGEVMRNIKEHEQKAAGRRAKRSECVSQCMPFLSAPKQPPAGDLLDHEKRKKKTNVEMRHVVLKDISLGLANADGNGPRPHMDLGRLEFGDFSREGNFTVVEDVVAALMHTALNHVMEHLQSLSWRDKMHEVMSALGRLSPMSRSDASPSSSARG